MKRAIFRITGRMLVDLFREDGKERHYRVLKGLPVDAKVCGAGYDSTRDIWEVAVESESFAEVAEYEMPPTLDAFTTYDLRCSQEPEEPPAPLLDGTGHLTEEGAKHFYSAGTVKEERAST